MELYLDSADIKEIEHAFKLGFIDGLTTTPTFMHREGITDIDAAIVKLSKIVPVLQIEAMGTTADEIVGEAYRQLELGLEKDKTVFKIPVSMEGVAACKRLVDDGIMVNIHLVYTLQQAYMAMAAGATYVTPLVGRLQDQGHDALALVEQCVEAVNYYGYDTKIMFSSVRSPEHVRNAINIGVHNCTIPWKVMKMLTENNFTALGTKQFETHTKLMMQKVRDIIRPENPKVTLQDTVLDAILQMTNSKLGAVSVVNEHNEVIGIFTDGDLRRYLSQAGRAILQNKLAEYQFKKPLTIQGSALLNEAVLMIKQHHVDNLIVEEDGKLLGMLDVQDLIEQDLLG